MASTQIMRLTDCRGEFDHVNEQLLKCNKHPSYQATQVAAATAAVVRLDGILFSRRRYPRTIARSGLPDWVWGVSFGVVFLIAVGGFFLLEGARRGGGGGCDKALPPLPGAPNVSAEGFQAEDDALAEAIRYLNQGDLDNTFAIFYGDVHAFTHNIDAEVRAVDEELAKELCERVIQLEEDYDPPPSVQRSVARMAASTTALREHLRDVAEALGFPRPGG